MNINITPLQKSYIIQRQIDNKKYQMESYHFSCKDFCISKFKKTIDVLSDSFDVFKYQLDVVNQKILVNKDQCIKTDYMECKDILEINECLNRKIEYFKNLNYLDIPYALYVFYDKDNHAEILSISDGIYFDGISQDLILHYIDKIYNNKKIIISDCFAEYSMLKVEKLNNINEEDIKFWRSKDKFFSQNPSFYIENKSDNINYYNICIKNFDYKRFSKIAEDHKVSVFSIFLTIYLKALSLYSINNSYSVIIPFSERTIDLDNYEIYKYALGLFSDFTLINYLKNNTNTNIWVETKKVQYQFFENLDHRDLSGPDIIKTLNKENGISFIPNTSFTCIENFNLKNDLLDKKECYLKTPGIDFETVVNINETSVNISITYSESFIKHDDINGIASIINQTVSKLLDNNLFEVSIPYNDLHIINKTNNTEKAFENKSLSELLKISFEVKEDKNFLFTKGRCYTYGEVKKIISGFQTAILKKGKVSKIALYMARGIYQNICELACTCMGIAFMPLEYELPLETAIECIQKNNIDLIITDRKYYNEIKREGFNCLNIDEARLTKGSEVIYKNFYDNQSCIIINTSGSTGLPKSVNLSQKGIVNCIYSTQDIFNITENDVSIQVTNYCHDMSIFDTILMAAYHGSVVVLDEKTEKNPLDWFSLIEKYNVTVWNSVPAFFDIFLSSSNDKMKSSLLLLKKIIFGGDFIHTELISKIKKINPFAEIFSVGGPTETTIWNIYHKITEEDLFNNYIPYGKPIYNTKYYVLNDYGENCPLGVLGSMYVEGPGVSLGYTGLSEENKKRFPIVNGKIMCNTGDLGFIQQDGSLIIKGRKDAQVKINGKRIDIEGIENLLLKNGSIKNIAVVLHNENKKLVAFYESDKEQNEEELYLSLKKQLPNYSIPFRFIRLDSIPLTQNNKINRKYLSDFDLKKEKFVKTDVIYDLSIETQILEICRKVLDNDAISLNSNFYYEGGDSLSAIKIISKIKNKIGKSVEVYDILNSPVIGDWIKNISNGFSDISDNNILDFCRGYFSNNNISYENDYFKMGGDGSLIFDFTERLNQIIPNKKTPYDILSYPYISDWIK